MPNNGGSDIFYLLSLSLCFFVGELLGALAAAAKQKGKKHKMEKKEVLDILKKQAGSMSDIPKPDKKAC